MKNFSLHLFFILFLSIFITFNKNALASGSGAYSVEVPDAAAMGMGSAFVGEADTPAAVYYNPAGINQISTSEISIGDAVIAPRGQMSQASDGNTVHLQNNEFNDPNIYLVVPVIPHKFTLGYAEGSYWGLGTNWGDNSPLRYATTQASIKDLDNSLVAAYQITDQWSIAASADNDYSKADQSKELSNQGTGPDGNIELKGSDDAWGYRIATLFKINDQNQFGLMYRSRINHDYDGKVLVNGVSSYIQGIYNLSGPSFVADAHLKTVLPQSVTFGYSYKPTEKWTINADLEWMDWSSAKYETITLVNATQAEQNYLSSGLNTPDDWHSAFSESIGTQYDLTNKFRIRAGYYHHGKVVPDATFNPFIPDSSSNGYTAGFGYDLTTRLTVDVAYSALIYQTRIIDNEVANGTVDGKYSTFINLGLVSLTYKF